MFVFARAYRTPARRADLEPHNADSRTHRSPAEQTCDRIQARAKQAVRVATVGVVFQTGVVSLL